MLGLRSWKSRVALGAAVAIAGSALGLYLVFRPQSGPVAHGHPTPTPQVATPPPAVVVGTTTETTAGAAEYLSVVSTKPPATQAGRAKVNTPITMSFNLPVDPAVVPNYFSVLPAMTGGFKQGETKQDVVFTPDGSFPPGGSVNVVVRKGLTSLDGFVLQDDFGFTFATQVAANSVSFQSGYSQGTLFSSSSGSMDVSVQIGSDVPSDATVQTYKATAADLVKSFIHGAGGKYIATVVDTSSMTLLDTKSDLEHNMDSDHNVPIKVAKPDGIYLLLVSNADGQYGRAWVTFSKYGVLLRQDDQKIVVAGQDLTTGDTNTKFDISFYRLKNRVAKIISGSFTGTGEFSAPYPAGLDLAVATAGGEEVIIPMDVPGANADIKIMGSLASQSQIYVTTDRAAYKKGETVKFAGVIRFDNDQAYTIPAATKVAVWLMDDSSTQLITKTIGVAANGTFAGGFVMPAAAFKASGADAQITLRAAATLPIPINIYTGFSTVIQALGPHTPSAVLNVTFDKTSYVARDTIAATITATDNAGKPLAGKALKLNVYSTQQSVAPTELANFPTPRSWGARVVSNVSLQLDATGHATYSFAANAAKKAADQQVTLFLYYGSGTTVAVTAKSTIVYQAADEVFLLPSRAVYRQGELINAPLVVETVAGQRVPNAAVSYELDTDDYSGSTVKTTVAGSGTLTTDENGVGTISLKTPAPENAGFTLKVKGKDVAGNVFQDIKYLSLYDTTSPILGYDGTDQLIQLSVATDKLAYRAGDTAHLVVTAPADMKALMAAERGRIHQYKWVTLAKGDNQVALDLSADLVPGFTLVFGYFHNGTYMTEGVPMVVSDPARSLTITVTPDQPSYAAGSTAHLDIAIKDSAGNPSAATVLVDGYDAAMSAYKLVDQAPIASTFLLPMKRATNASSSLTAIGGFGGRCGGGYNPDQPAKTNAGQLVVWLPALAIDATGHASIDVPISTKAVRLVLIASTPSAAVGQVEMDLAVQ